MKELGAERLKFCLDKIHRIPRLNSEPIDTHAEMNIPERLLSISPQPKKIKIGVSKRCCFLCTEFFKIVQDDYKIGILFSGMHNKVYAGWKPPKCEEKYYLKMKELVEARLEVCLDKIHRIPRFNSEPIDSD